MACSNSIPCRRCTKKFHSCGSCDLLFSWEYDYCSKACWIAAVKEELTKLQIEYHLTAANILDIENRLLNVNYMTDFHHEYQ